MVVYSTPAVRNVFGAAYAGPIFKKIVDNIYLTEKEWRMEIENSERLKKMPSQDLPYTKNETSIVPKLSGLGLMDAIYSIENCGYKCHYTGIGHVVKQNPASGTKLRKGSTISITLK